MNIKLYRILLFISFIPFSGLNVFEEYEVAVLGLQSLLATVGFLSLIIRNQGKKYE